MSVILALFFTVFVGMTGLGIDFAFSTLERRALQNAADASALTGARDLSQGTTPTTDIATASHINRVVRAGRVYNPDELMASIK